MQELHLYSTVFLMIVFTLFYLVLPNRRRRLTRALPARSARPSRGTSSLRRFRFMSTIFRVPSSLYGSLTLLLFSLLWLYICISIIFYGALFNRLLERRFG